MHIFTAVPFSSALRIIYWSTRQVENKIIAFFWEYNIAEDKRCRRTSSATLQVQPALHNAFLFLNQCALREFRNTVHNTLVLRVYAHKAGLNSTELFKYVKTH